MKKIILFCFISLLNLGLSSNLFAQKDKLINDISQYACACIEKIDLDQSPTALDKAGERCMEKAFMSHMYSIEEEYGIQNLEGDKGYEIGQEIGILMVQDCRAFIDLNFRIEGVTSSNPSQEILPAKSDILQQVSAHSCECFSKEDDKISPSKMEELAKTCIENTLNKKKFSKKIDKELGHPLSEKEHYQLKEQIALELLANCSSFKEFAATNYGGTVDKKSSQMLGRAMSTDVCDCLQKVQLNDTSVEAINKATEDCIANSMLSQLEKIMEIYGEKVNDENFEDEFMNGPGADMIVDLMQTCPKFVKIMKITTN